MGLFVVETYDDLFLGSVEFREGGLLVRPGFQGHPFEVPQEDVIRLLPADEHEAATEVWS